MVGKVRVVVRDFTLLVFFLLAHSLVSFRSFRVSLFFMDLVMGLYYRGFSYHEACSEIVRNMITTLILITCTFRELAAKFRFRRRTKCLLRE